jgi:hypothetical protein
MKDVPFRSVSVTDIPTAADLVFNTSHHSEPGSLKQVSNILDASSLLTHIQDRLQCLYLHLEYTNFPSFLYILAGSTHQVAPFHNSVFCHDLWERREARSGYKILIREPEGKRLLGRPWHNGRTILEWILGI